MWKRHRTWLLLVAFTGVALAVYFEPSHCVRGWLWGEAFFDGRPTSWWRGVVERDLQIDPHMSPQVPTPPTWWERFTNWVGYRPQVDSSLKLMENGQADEILQEMMRDEDEHIAAVAKDCLQFHREMMAEDVPAPITRGPILMLGHWHRLIGRHTKNTSLPVQ